MSEDNDIEFMQVVKYKLKDGMVIRNYKELCGILDESILQGKSRILQMEKWKRFFLWEKIEGTNKIKIIEVCNTPKEEVWINKNELINSDKEVYSMDDVKSLERVNINLLVQSKNNHVTIPKALLLELLYMVNLNYKKYNYNTNELSEKTNIKKQDIDEFYLLTNKLLRNNLTKALESLQRKNMIFWNKIWIIKIHSLEGNEIYREATKNEYEFIMETKDTVLRSMGLKEEWQVYTYNRWREYVGKIDEILLKEINVEFYYEAYDIVLNRSKIAREWFKLSDEEKMIEKESVNSGMLERVLKLAQDRRNRAIKKNSEHMGISKDEDVRRRGSKDYLYNFKQLGNLLLDKKTKEM